MRILGLVMAVVLIAAWISPPLALLPDPSNEGASIMALNVCVKTQAGSSAKADCPVIQESVVLPAVFISGFTMVPPATPPDDRLFISQDIKPPEA